MARIVDYDTFISLPSGTLYCETEPQIFGELQIKLETINDGNYWFLSRLKESFDNCEDFYSCYKELESGRDLSLDYDISERDGMFDYDRKFLVYSKKDVEDLINKLKTLL